MARGVGQVQLVVAHEAHAIEARPRGPCALQLVRQAILPRLLPAGLPALPSDVIENAVRGGATVAHSYVG